jgi:hypothetical protein
VKHCRQGREFDLVRLLAYALAEQGPVEGEVAVEVFALDSDQIA